MVFFAAPAAAGAQETIDLGAGMSVTRSRVACIYDPLFTCTWWAPTGLSFGDSLELPRAATFARTSSGRIVAMLAWSGASHARPSRAALLYTDDRGAHWREADWPETQLSAIAIAFDPRGPTGIAVGADGSVWSTDDEGLRWRRRRSSTGSGFRAVWVRGRTCVIEDAEGALWLSRDRGFSLSTLSPRGAQVHDDGESLTIASARPIRIDATGTLHAL